MKTMEHIARCLEVATRMMGWEVSFIQCSRVSDENGENMHHPYNIRGPGEIFFAETSETYGVDDSFDPFGKIEHAWLVIDRLRELGLEVSIEIGGDTVTVRMGRAGHWSFWRSAPVSAAANLITEMALEATDGR